MARISPYVHDATRRRLTLVVSICAGVPLLAGCGGSGKPAYCSSVSSLESSIKAIPTTGTVQNGLSGLQSAAAKVKSDADALVKSAKGDFPSETSAVKNAGDKLAATLGQLKGSPKPATIAQLPGEVSALVSAVNAFTSATSSKCG